MRRLSAILALVLISGCTSRKDAVRFDGTATMLNIADPRADRQLIKGFFPLEGPVRWTGQTFSVTLKPPMTAARKGAVLLLRFGIPEPSIEVLHSLRLSALVNGISLAPQEYTKAGEFDYVRDVPGLAFRGGNATVDFALDKALTPSATEHRELGVTVNTVGFEAK